MALSALALGGLSGSVLGQSGDHAGLTPQATVHAGVQLIGATLTGTDGWEAFYGELNTGLRLDRLPMVTLMLDGRLESLDATEGVDDHISLFAQVRPGARLQLPLVSNMTMYGEASAVQTWEWYRKNGELQDDYPARYTTGLYSVGVADQYRGAQWRLGGAFDEYQSLAGRQPLQVRGDVHIVEEGRRTWGVNGRASIDYLSLGLSLRLR